MDRRAWRLLPSELVLWHGRRKPGVPYDRRWTLGPVLLLAFATITGLFGSLLALQEMPGVRQTFFVAASFAILGVLAILAPRHYLDGCEYLVTDRRLHWKRGRIHRSMDRDGITYARILWHRSVPGVGHLELVRAVPFGPLARRQRLIFQDIKEPDAVFAIIRGVERSENLGDSGVPLIERLDPNEIVEWGGHPEGWHLGWREIGTAMCGAGTLVLAIQYGYRAGGILLGLEELGLRVKTWEWSLLFLAVLITWLVLLAVAAGLIWYGVWRARALGRETEYVVTDTRLLIRRGRIELSLDRRRIVDVAEKASTGGLHHLFLVLDSPESRALADSGALRLLLPSRDSVPPVLYELRDKDKLKEILLRRNSRPSEVNTAG